MVKNRKTRAPLGRCGVCAILLLALTSGACSRDTSPRGDRSQVSNSTNASSGGAAAVAAGGGGASSDPASFDAEILRLEKHAEKSPADDTVNVSLSQAYVRRAKAFRQRGQLREAERDYQEALRRDPDNEEAQQGTADISQQTEGPATGENGEPAPLPITPNATSSDDEDPAPKNEPSPLRKKQ